jgi:hypothetical protein
MPKETRKKSARIAEAAKLPKKKEPVQTSVVIEEFKDKQPLPTLQDGKLFFSDYPRFQPNLTPKQVLGLGSFGGTYFRPIYSSITGKNHSDEYLDLPKDWFEKLPAKFYKSKIYDTEINKYKVSCGGDLHMWESSGWITTIDPYGWFQWYCRFYLGRRCSDDQRQISRGMNVFGPTGRWKRNLVNQLMARVKNPKDDKELLRVLNDYGVSPKIRQLLQHWGYEVTLADLK